MCAVTSNAVSLAGLLAVLLLGQPLLSIAWDVQHYLMAMQAIAARWRTVPYICTALRIACKALSRAVEPTEVSRVLPRSVTNSMDVLLCCCQVAAAVLQGLH
jgi:hypothetical protein